MVAWCSKKSRRVTRSVLAAELFDFSATYDIGYTTWHTISIFLQRTVTLCLFIDSQRLWDAITSLTPLAEWRLAIEIAGLRQAYRVGELHHLCRIDSSYNPADNMTKKGANSYLAEVLQTGKLNHTVELFVYHGRGA